MGDVEPDVECRLGGYVYCEAHFFETLQDMIAFYTESLLQGDLGLVGGHTVA